ncbi:hypothetical protein [Leucothrix pacifica]|uniref:Phasin domain-containing protein n=1 Tax=Leucothrix pacifica TaxID=1247513 RepID=A0A317CBX5_9GAMM|nr:hypothetical protein [Leucothrix pacifica]PWQ94833.1 hypothetical protein DKW60_16465 [Leucothrix pacifica]
MQLYLESVKTFNKLVDLSMTVSQLSAVSAQTIAYRTMFMQHGAATPRWQENEAQTMTLEKVDAAQAGSQVLWKGWVEMNQSILAACQKNIRRSNNIDFPAAPIDLISTQSQIMKVTEACAIDGFKLSNEIIDTLKKSIKPAYSYAAGNANRLSVKK